MRVENKQLKQEIRRRDRGTNVVRPIGKSKRFLEVLKLAEHVAPTDSTVLIQGESGTGKEVVARYIHNLSSRSEGPFMSINCGALPENLLESELFGHVKGSFTGAVRDKQGLFAAARGGTFFLDEVGEMPPSLQVKLLRVLQEREVIPVGATESIPVDVGSCREEPSRGGTGAKRRSDSSTAQRHRGNLPPRASAATICSCSSKRPGQSRPIEATAALSAEALDASWSRGPGKFATRSA